MVGSLLGGIEGVMLPVGELLGMGDGEMLTVGSFEGALLGSVGLELGWSDSAIGDGGAGVTDGLFEGEPLALGSLLELGSGPLADGSLLGCKLALGAFPDGCGLKLGSLLGEMLGTKLPVGSLLG
jgi:hypothetical protein